MLLRHMLLRCWRGGLWALVVGCTIAAAQSLPATRDWHVRPGADGDGSSTAPFGRLAEALAVATAGDRVLLAPGTYDEALTTVRGGVPGAPLTIAALSETDRPVLTRNGRVATIGHPHIVVDGLVFDGQFGADDAVRVQSAAAGLVLRHVEVRRTSRDCIDMGAPADVTIEHSLVHHCLNAARGRTDAHGIVAGAARNLTIRSTEVHTFSGDAIQLDPGRAAPGWTNLRVEGCRLWLAPLPEAVNGFAAGVVPGENAIDTKTTRSGDRATLTVVNTEAWGFRGGLINNMAAFNIKERVDATFDRVTVHSSELAFRLRGAPGIGARVGITNTVVYDTATAVRYEDDIDDVRLHHVTIGREVGRVFQRASSPGTTVDVRNLLVLGASLPREAAGRGLAVGAADVVDAAAHDYRPAPESAAIDAATPLPHVTHDRLGVLRPQGSGPDIGAYERCQPACPPAAPTGLRGSGR